jgi:hypothetical protein
LAKRELAKYLPRLDLCAAFVSHDQRCISIQSPELFA